MIRVKRETVENASPLPKRIEMRNGKLPLAEKKHQLCQDKNCAWFPEQYCAFWDNDKEFCDAGFWVVKLILEAERTYSKPE